MLPQTKNIATALFAVLISTVWAAPEKCASPERSAVCLDCPLPSDVADRCCTDIRAYVVCKMCSETGSRDNKACEQAELFDLIEDWDAVDDQDDVDKRAKYMLGKRFGGKHMLGKRYATEDDIVEEKRFGDKYMLGKRPGSDYKYMLGKRSEDDKRKSEYKYMLGKRPEYKYMLGKRLGGKHMLGK